MPTIVKFLPNCKLAKQSDWFQEYLAPVLAIKIVDSIDDAIEHITTVSYTHLTLPTILLV